MRAMVQAAVGYDAAVDAGLGQHLRGTPPGDYLRATGAVIARASRLVEPILAPSLRSLVADRRPRRILNVGCGTGVYLIHAATAGDPQLTGLGVDLDPTVVGLARQRVADAGLAERFDVRQTDIRTVELPAASFDLVLLSQNIYYFRRGRTARPAGPPPRAAGPRRRARARLPLFAGRSLAAAHYDLLFRATAGCGPASRLPAGSGGVAPRASCRCRPRRRW